FESALKPGAGRRVGPAPRLDAVEDQFAGSKRVFHPDMPHRDAVADADRRDQNRGAAGHPHAGFDGVGQLIEVHVAGHNLAVGGYDADQRAFELLRRVAQSVKQAAVGRALGPLFDVIAAQNHSFLSEFYLLSQLIILRSSAPTFSIRCSLCIRRSARKWVLRPPLGLISVRNSLAKVPSWISVRTFFISLRVSSVIRRLPVR